MFFSFSLSAQKLGKQTYIKVMGVENYVEMAYAQAIELTFIEDPNKCDPVKGNLTLTEQFNYFSRELAKSNIIFTNFNEIEQTPQMRFKHKNFSYTTNRSEELEVIKKIAFSQSIQVNKTYFVMPTHNFVAEDARAVAALRDATKRAKSIAAKLGGKKVTIVAIDDDTSELQTEDLFDEWTEKAPNEESKEQLLELITLLTQIDNREMLKEQSQNASRRGGYMLWVTFQVE